MTGQAAGALAAVSVRDGRMPREVHAMRVQWELLSSGVNLSLCNYSDVPPEHPVNKSVQIANMYGLVDANEYPHAPSYNIREFEDPVLAMAIIRGQDKGVFGVGDIITRGTAAEIIARGQKAVGAGAVKVLAGKSGDFVSRGDFVKAVCDAFPKLKDIDSTQSRLTFRIREHRNSEYAEILGRLGILDVYARDSEFYYGRPVTKGEAADVIVRACIASAGA